MKEEWVELFRYGVFKNKNPYGTGEVIVPALRVDLADQVVEEIIFMFRQFV